MHKLLPQIYSLCKQGKDHAALDILFDHVDDLLDNQSWQEVGDLLIFADEFRLSSTLMFGFLAVTRVADEIEDIHECRQNFGDRAIMELEYRGTHDDPHDLIGAILQMSKKT